MMETIHFATIFIARPTAGGYELLLGQRSPTKTYMGGTWQLVSGRIEPGETAWQAAVRETKEETGLPLRELYRLTQVTTFYRADLDAVCVGINFCGVVEADARPTINAENTQLQWLSPDAAAARLMWPNDLAGLAEVRDQILTDGVTKPHLRIDLT